MRFLVKLPLFCNRILESRLKCFSRLSTFNFQSCWLVRIIILPALATLYFSGCASEMGRGSTKALYTITETLEVRYEDIGKEIQLRLDQKLFFHFSKNPEEPGTWKLIDYSRRPLLLLSETPRVSSGAWGLLFQARAMGSGEIELVFEPDSDAFPSRTIKFEISITR